MGQIIYPKTVDEKLVIGITAPSSGLGVDYLRDRFELVKKQHIEQGVDVIAGNCLMSNQEFVSGSAKDRIHDFIKMWNNPQVNLIHPPWGGEHLIDMLELIDFDKLKESPTWVQGYSDTSTLLFAITTKTGIATAHGTNFMDFISGQDKLTAESRDYLKLKKGDIFVQNSSDKWQKQFVNFKDNLNATYNLTENTEWKLLNSANHKIEIKGRIIGGCLDTISEICNTPYGNLHHFRDQYCNNDGLILYLENCEQNPIQLYRILYKFKYSGWFDNLNSLIFGRNSGPENDHFSYLSCLKKVFKDVSYPIIYDADIGHKPPQMTIINGSLANLTIEDGNAVLKQRLC